MRKELLLDMIYEVDEEKVKSFLAECNDEELYVFAYNYTWGNGFDIPAVIINNPCCSLSTALLVFYRADGYSFMLDKEADTDLLPCHTFVSDVYTRIINGDYKPSDVAFVPPLTKVQLFKLKKQLNKSEEVLITAIDGKNYDIDI